MQALIEALKEEEFKIVSDGSDNHLILGDVKGSCGLTGKEAEELLDKIHITVNKNTIPKETEKPMVSSGIRIGTPAMTTRGFKENEFKKVGHIIATALKNSQDEEILQQLNQEVLDLTSQF